MLAQKKYNFDVKQISDIASMYLDNILEELDINVKKYSRYYVGCCPVHGGDNATAFNIYPDGYTKKCHWVCNTHHCEKKYISTIIGLVRGVLTYQTNRYISFNEATEWIINFCKIDVNNITVNLKDVEKKRFFYDVNIYSNKTEILHTDITRNQIRNSLEIPAQYYIDKGYSAKILDEYDVGLCTNPHKPMYNRVVFPVYDRNYIGCIGRSIHQKCSVCKYHHAKTENCPTTEYEKLFCSKWLNSNGFRTEMYLYNFWKQNQQKEIFLVEGPGDVLRLIDCGITNVVGCFGAKFSETQQILLEQLGLYHVKILMDNDDAGIEAAEIMYDKLKRYYKVTILKCESKDIGDANCDEINRVCR